MKLICRFAKYARLQNMPAQKSQARPERPGMCARAPATKGASLASVVC